MLIYVKTEYWAQLLKEQTEKSLKQGNITRWNSQLAMIQRMTEVIKILKSTVAVFVYRCLNGPPI